MPAVKPAAVVGPRLRTSYVGPDARAKSANAAPPRPPGGAARAAYALVRGFTTSTRRGKSAGSFLGTKARDGETTIRGLYASPSARLAFGACRPLGDGKRRVTRAASGDACHPRAGACDPGTSSSWKIARAEQATGVEPAEGQCGALACHLDTPAWWWLCRPPELRKHRGQQGWVRRSMRPTPWNRTRTSRASAGRPDQLGESGATNLIIVVYSVVSTRTQGAPVAIRNLWQDR